MSFLTYYIYFCRNNDFSARGPANENNNDSSSSSSSSSTPEIGRASKAFGCLFPFSLETSNSCG